MPRNSIKLNYKIQAHLTQFGENIRTARLRRNITMEELSIQSDISLPTLRNIEAGNPNVSIGSYIKVLTAIGLEKDITRVAFADPIGRQLHDQKLGERANKNK
jgi:transcriptional regulator with XRE-family HTH domain